MINVRMGEDNRVDGAWVKGNIAVPFAGFLAWVLEEIAIQEHLKLLTSSRWIEPEMAPGLLL
jgi:hypothetical protein